nr:phage protein Gp36 family protein [Enterobacter roggenkampii]
MDSCIRYADELIDAHLRGRYTLPLADDTDRSAGHCHHAGAVTGSTPAARKGLFRIP